MRVPPTTGRSRRRRLRRAAVASALVLLGLTGAPAGAPAQATGEDKALGRPATASSFQATTRVPPSCVPWQPAKANDGRSDTRWGSAFLDDQYWQDDLGGPRAVDTVHVNWEVSYASRYRISTSLDGASFSPAATVSISRPGLEVTTFAPRLARYVRVTGIARSDRAKGISIWDARVYGPPDATLLPPAPPPPAPSPGDLVLAQAPAPRLISPVPTVRIRGTLTAAGARIRLLAVRAPAGAMIEVRCRGRGCPARALRGAGPRVRFRALERRLEAGTVIEVRVTALGQVGKYTRLVIRRGRKPARSSACLEPGVARPSPCPAG